MLVTNVGADYTKLGSFGSAQDFGQNLVVSMDRTYLLRRRKNVGPVQVRRKPPELVGMHSCLTPVAVCCLVERSSIGGILEREHAYCMTEGGL